MADNLPRHKPVPFTVTVTDVVPEAKDAVTLVLQPDIPCPPYRAGQFLTIAPQQFAALRSATQYLESLKGKKELVRSYSMSSAPHEPLAVTVKEEPYFPGVSKHAPLLSPFLTYAPLRGTQLAVTGFTGPYILPPDIELRTDHVVHLVAGSGAVPNFSILKDSLRQHPKVRHTFLSSNKTWEDALFRVALAKLAAEFPERLRVVHTLTRQEDVSALPGQVRKGRVGVEMLRELIPDSATAFAYVCGPAIPAWERRAALETKVSPAPRFLETCIAALEEIGFSRDRIKREAFG